MYIRYFKTKSYIIISLSYKRSENIMINKKMDILVEKIIRKLH